MYGKPITDPFGEGGRDEAIRYYSTSMAVISRWTEKFLIRNVFCLAAADRNTRNAPQTYSE